MTSDSTLGKGISEVRKTLELATPIMIGQIAQTANGFVDTVMAGRVSAVDMAAVAIGASIWVPIFLCIAGILLATTPIVAQLFGASKFDKIGPTVQQSLWLALPLGIFGFIAIRLAERALHFMGVEPELIPITTGYLDGLSWGIPPIALYVVLRSYSEGMSLAKPVMFINIAGLLVNIPVNYVLIFGKLGFPALGGVGCGWATAFVMWFMLGMALILCLKGKKYQRYRLFKTFNKPKSDQIFRVLKLGLPIGLSIFFEVSIFAVIAMMLGSLGAEIVAGHQIAMNFASLIFMIPLSLGIALTIRVGHQAGTADRSRLRLTCISGMVVVALIAVTSSTLMLLFEGYIVIIYTNNPRVADLALILINYAALFQLSDGLQVGANGALRGLKDTKIPMLITMFAYWVIALPLGYSLGMTHLWGDPMGARGFWIGLLVGLTVAAIFLNLRLWSKIRPISKQGSH